MYINKIPTVMILIYIHDIMDVYSAIVRVDMGIQYLLYTM